MFSTPVSIRKAVSTFVSPAKALIHRRKTEKVTTTSIFDLVSAVDSVKDVKPAKQSNKKSAARVLAYLNQLHYDDVPEIVMHSLPLIPAEMRSATQIPADAPPCYETLFLDESVPAITTPVLEPSSPTPSVESDDGPLTPTLDAASIAGLAAPAPTPATDAVIVHSVSVSDDEDSDGIFEDADDVEEDAFSELLLHVNVLTAGKDASPAAVDSDSDSDDEDEVIDVEEDSDEDDEEEETTERVNCVEHSPVITMEEFRDFMLAKGRFGRKPLHPRVAFLRRHAD